MLFAGKSHSLPRERTSNFSKHGSDSMGYFEVSTSWVREMTPMPIRFGGIIAECARMANGNKWRRANVKKCIRNLGILPATNR